MKYVSRRYLREKFENLEWDLIKCADIQNTDTDEDCVDENTVKKIKENVIYSCQAIINELS